MVDGGAYIRYVAVLEVPVADVALTEEVLRERIRVFVKEYIEKFGVAPNLGVLARLYGKRASRLGHDIRSLLASDDRFTVNMVESGKTLIVVDFD